MVRNSLSEYISLNLSQYLPSTIYSTPQQLVHLKSASNTLYSMLAVMAPMAFANSCPGRINNSCQSVLITSDAIPSGTLDYFAFLGQELSLSDQILGPLVSSDRFILENKHSEVSNYIETYNSEVKVLCRFDGSLMSKMVEESLGEVIRNYCGSHFRVTDARPFETSFEINNGLNANNAIHKDGGPDGVFKIMIYLSDVTRENGPFCIVDRGQLVPIEGPAGTVVLFQNRLVDHCALPVLSGRRQVLMLEVIPSLMLSPDPFEIRPSNSTQIINPFE